MSHEARAIVLTEPGLFHLGAGVPEKKLTGLYASGHNIVSAIQLRAPSRSTKKTRSNDLSRQRFPTQRNPSLSHSQVPRIFVKMSWLGVKPFKKFPTPIGVYTRWNRRDPVLS